MDIKNRQLDADRPWVVFDFDKTLTYKDTVFGFFWFASKTSKGRLIKACFYWGLIVAAKLGFFSLNQAKNLGVKWFLGHHDAVSLNKISRRYAESIALNRIYHTHYEAHRQNALIVSASLDCYLKHLFDADRVIAAELKYDATNHPVGIQKGCQGEAKLERLAELGIERIHQLYTDSRSDAPLAEIADEIYLVKGNEVRKVDTL